MSLLRVRMQTLVCCGAGMSRSPTVAAVAVGLVAGEPAEEVLKRFLMYRVRRRLAGSLASVEAPGVTQSRSQHPAREKGKFVSV